MAMDAKPPTASLPALLRNSRRSCGARMFMTRQIIYRARSRPPDAKLTGSPTAASRINANALTELSVTISCSRKAMPRLLFFGCFVGVSLLVQMAVAQELSFEAASIRPNPGCATQQRNGRSVSPGRLNLECTTLQLAIENAYAVWANAAVASACRVSESQKRTFGIGQREDPSELLSRSRWLSASKTDFRNAFSAGIGLGRSAMKHRIKEIGRAHF